MILEKLSLLKGHPESMVDDFTVEELSISQEARKYENEIERLISEPRNFGDTDGNNKYSSNVKSAKFAAADADPSDNTYRTELVFTKDITAVSIPFQMKYPRY